MQARVYGKPWQLCGMGFGVFVFGLGLSMDPGDGTSLQSVGAMAAGAIGACVGLFFAFRIREDNWLRSLMARFTRR